MRQTQSEYYAEHNIPYTVVGNHVIVLDEVHKTYSVYVNGPIVDYTILSNDSEAISEVLTKLQLEGYTLFSPEGYITCECGCTTLN